ncbi:MAG: RNA polymerase sigma factor [Myxococcota bacterium]|nr:RNA polymerase sigma factor [Myxococcota bacterium]
MPLPSAHVRPNLRLVPDAPPAPPSVPAPSLDDSELLAAVRTGDSEAATALYDRVRPQIERTICRLLASSDVDHDDVAQLAMIELVSTIGRYRGECSLDTWTSTITTRVVYKHIRRRKTERRVFGALDGDLLAAVPSSANTGREVMLRIATPRVLSHLSAIEENKAWTFFLHDVCGYDLREIAQITGVGIAAAQTRLVRGRREVHERIAADPDLARLLESMEREA